MQRLRQGITFLVVFVALCASVSAIGISVPEQYRWEFTPNFAVRVEFRVYNSYDVPMYAELKLSGDLKEYGSIDEDIIDMTPRGIGAFFVTLELPESMPPGKHRLNIAAIERPKISGTMSGSTAVTVFLEVSVPYEGKHVVAKLHVPNTPEDQTLRPEVSLENLGTVGVEDAYADVVIYDEGQEVDRITTNHAPVPAKGVSTLTANLAHTLQAGVYTANATVYADDNTTYAEDDFLIGEKDVELVSITTQLEAGKVNPIGFTLLNRWNRRLINVDTVISTGPDPKNSWRAAGPLFTLEAWKATGKEFYMNVPVTASGTYQGFVTVHFEGGSREFPVEFTVKPSPVLERPSKEQRALKLLPVRLLFVVLVIVLLYLYYRARHDAKRRMV